MEPGAFSQLEQLTQLDLSDCRIDSLAPGAFLRWPASPFLHTSPCPGCHDWSVCTNISHLVQAVTTGASAPIYVNLSRLSRLERLYRYTSPCPGCHDWSNCTDIPHLLQSVPIYLTCPGFLDWSVCTCPVTGCGPCPLRPSCSPPAYTRCRCTPTPGAATAT